MECNELQDKAIFDKQMPDEADLEGTHFGDVISFYDALREGRCPEYACESCERNYCGKCEYQLMTHEKKCKKRQRV